MYSHWAFRGSSFSIHALLAESDPVVTSTAGVATNFLSTLSLRRATPKSVIYLLDEYFLSTLSLRRATRALLSGSGSLRLFYPRSPCGERPRGRAVLWVPSPFLSTLSLRRATISMGIAAPATAIFYPRSPCGERRPRQWGFRLWGKIFYPRSPCGERRLWVCSAGFGCFFLSTLSLRRATLATW